MIALVDRAGRDVGGAEHVLVDEPLVVTQVEVGLSAVLGHEHLAVLEGVHRAGVDVDVGVELLHHDPQAAGLEEPSEGGGGDAPCRGWRPHHPSRKRASPPVLRSQPIFQISVSRFLSTEPHNDREEIRETNLVTTPNTQNDNDTSRARGKSAQSSTAPWASYRGRGPAATPFLAADLVQSLQPRSRVDDSSENETSRTRR